MELSLNSLTKQYDTLTAVKDLNLTMTSGVYGLLGANGAGKTTLLNLISGIYSVDDGSIMMCGSDITNIPSHKLCQRHPGRP